jgi:hypothetical protein
MKAAERLVCWKCGAELKGVILPLSRRETCAACGAEQHVCRLCRHYDPRAADMCREERAETVSNKERANFCDYFDPMPGAWKPARAEPELAKQKLAALFGEQPASAPESAAGSAADKARAELEKLFGDDRKDGGKQS